MPRVFMELRSYRLFRFPNRANPSPSSLSWTQSFALRHRRASVHEASVAGLAPSPPLSPSATIVPSLRPPSHLRRPTSPRSTTATTWRQTLHCCSVPLLRRVSCASFTIYSHRRTANSPRGKFKMRYFFFVLYIFLWFR